MKSGTNPEGLVAGEAAGVFLLELESHAIRRNAGILAYISAWGRDAEPHPWTGKAPSVARGLRNAFEETFSVLPGKGEEIDMVIADLNGERARANEWAITAARTFPIDDKVRELKHPADCTGDCGAAMGAVLLATAIDIMSGALPPATIALATSDDDGARRILCLQAGNYSGINALAPDEYEKSPAVVPAVIEQHSDDASFLWLIRAGLIKAPHTALQDLKRHDERIEANLDGLCRAGEAGWEISRKSLRHGDAGAYFTTSFLAFKSGDRDRIAYPLDKGGTDINAYKGMVSALGWLPYDEAEPSHKEISHCRTATSPVHRHSGKHHSPPRSRTFSRRCRFRSLPVTKGPCTSCLRGIGEEE